MQLKGVETRLARKSCGRHEFVAHLVHVRLVHRAPTPVAGQQSALVESAHRTHQRPLDLHAGHEGAAMGNLRRDRGALGMHRIGQRPQIGQDLRAHPDLVWQGATDLAHRGVGDRGQRDTAAREITMVADQRAGRGAIQAHRLVGAGFDEAVAQPQRPDLYGFEQFGSRAHVFAPPSTLPSIANSSGVTCGRCRPLRCAARLRANSAVISGWVDTQNSPSAI